MTLGSAGLAAGIAAIAACFTGAAFAASPDALKGKIKPGLYEYKMEMRGIPGMPPGMGNHTMQHCVTQEDVERGEVGRKDSKSECDMKDLNVSGNTATMRMECKNGTQMHGKMTFRSDGYTMDNEMEMPARKGGEAMHMQQHLDARYLGPCSGR